MSQLESSKAGGILYPWRRVSLPALFRQLIGGGPPTLGRPICFAQTTDLNVNLIQKHHHRNIQNNVGANIQSCGAAELARKWLSEAGLIVRICTDVETRNPRVKWLSKVRRLLRVTPNALSAVCSCLIKSMIPGVTTFNFFHWSVSEKLLCRYSRCVGFSCDLLCAFWQTPTGFLIIQLNINTTQS